MHGSSFVCPNCDTPEAGRFCHVCGQDNRLARLRVRDWFGELFDFCSNLNRPLIRTLRQLAYRPGQLVRDYVDGKRVRYTNPLRFALITSAIWWLFVRFQPEPSDLDAGARLLRRYGQLINLVLLPLLAVIQRVAYLGSKTTVAECMCFQLYVSGFVFFWRAAIAGVHPILPTDFPIDLAILDQVMFLIYLAYALWGFHRGSVWIWPLRVLLTMSGFVVFSGLAVAGLARVAVWWGV